MAHTIRTGGTRDGKSYESNDRRPYFRTEAKWARKTTNRATRRNTTALLASDADHDAAPYPTHLSTGGWVTH